MNTWHGYYIISRITANLNESNWVTVIELVRQIQVNGGRNEYDLQERPNLDTFTTGEDETLQTWSNQYTNEARYAEGAVSFDKFAQKLADAFGVAVEDISYTTAVQDGNVYATYTYGASNRMRVGLFGCPDDVNLCDWNTSRLAHNAYIAANDADWNGVSE